MNKIQTVVKYYKDRENLSYRKFAEELNTHILQGKYSHQAIKDWVDGRSEPRLGTMLQISVYTSNKTHWCVEMAEEIISILEEKISSQLTP